MNKSCKLYYIGSHRLDVTSVDPDVMGGGGGGHYESPYQDIRCLQSQTYFISVAINVKA